MTETDNSREPQDYVSLRIFPVVFMLAAVSSGLLGCLIVVSLTLADQPTHQAQFIWISVAVGAMFLGLAALLLGLRRQFTRLARALNASACGHAADICSPLKRSTLLLNVAGVVTLLLLGIIGTGVIARIREGAAVFG